MEKIMTGFQASKKKKTSMILELKASKVNQSIDYLGALQSTFQLAHTINYRLGAKTQITHVTWAFYLDKESKTRKSIAINLATTATLKEDLALIEFTVGQSAFSGHTLATQIPAFSDALKSALKTCLEVIEASHSKDDGWTLTNSQITIAFVLDNQNQLILTEGSRDAKNNVIHKIMFTLQ
jgi:hypothetical protein